MNWIYNGQEIEEIPEGYVGFVYLITNNITGRKYVGKKLFTSSRTKSVKGKKKKVRVESNWKEYFGSNEDLKNEVAANGEENFTREILHLCKNKGTCNYLELREQIDRRALESDAYYNYWVSVRIHKSHIKIEN